MLKNTLTGLNKKKLRRWLLLFFFALAIPTAVLVQQSYSRLKWETFHQHQVMADELASRIDAELYRLIKAEEDRSFTDYSFLNIAGDPKASLLQRSPLSKFPIESQIKGLLGFFQVDSDGKLMTPLLPDAVKQGKDADIYGIAKTELALRTEVEDKIQEILSQNKLVKKAVPVIHKVAKKKESKSMLGRLIGSSRSASDGASSDNMGISTNNNSIADTDAEIYTADTVVSESDVYMQADHDIQANAQIAFDQLKEKVPSKMASNNLGRIEDLNLKQSYKGKFQNKKDSFEVSKQMKASSKEARFSKNIRIERNSLPETEVIINQEKSRALPKNANTDLRLSKKSTKNRVKSKKGSLDKNTRSKQSLRIRTFESTIDSFEFSQLDSGHFVLFRKVWLNKKRYIQGLLIEQQPFLNQLINNAFRRTSLSQMSDLLVSYQGNVLSAFSGRTRGYLTSSKELSGELLYQTRLSDPFSDLQLTFSITRLPIGAGGKVILWLSFILGIILCAGFYLMYRLGLGQINLANQQQDFVSAVSHELKTPLTSIRMYGEILREGWASEEKKKSYYNFIYDESERLSRLINNVLHLARMTRNKQSAELKEIKISSLMEEVNSKISTQIKHAGFELITHCNVDSSVNIDADWFSQIMINLVDNAIKFSAKADIKKIELSCLQLNNKDIIFNVRDFGPGVDKTQMKKIFKLFYRTESELTRETVGTGIGLALVHQMVVNMGGKIDVTNHNPGAEFRVTFKVV